MSGILTQSTTGDQIQMEAPGPWVIERKFRCSAEPSSTVPYSALLLDRQYFLAQGKTFVRHVRQVHHNQATAPLSQINIPFAPHRETLTIHWVRIWRAGEPISQLRTADEITLKQGKSPNRVVAHLTLDDLRRDDSLDVAYSVQAHTPKRRFSTINPTCQRVPVLDWNLTVIAPPDIELSALREKSEFASSVRELSEGSKFYQWQLSDLPAINASENTPVWYRHAADIQVTSKDSWPQVAAAIHRAWQIPTLGSKEESLAREFNEAAGGDIWEAARRASRFVQDNITTLPTVALTQSPLEASDVVLENLAGDAKAKACLLVQLLRSLGIPAAPVLVSRTRLKTISAMLPAAELFDHVIVRGRWEEQDLWIDPTATHQAGPIQTNTLAPYGAGLQVSPRTKSPSGVPLPDPKQNSLTISEHFVVDADGSASLKVSTRAIGIDANKLRKQAASSSKEQLGASRLASLEHLYSGTTRTQEIEIIDNTEDNEITLEEKFHLPYITSGEQNIARFTPLQIRRCLPNNVNRTSHPVALEFPRNTRQLTVIDTPWPVATSESSGNSPGTAFACSYKHSASGQRHTLRYSFSTLADHIVPVDADSVQMRLDELRPHLSYRFAPPAPSSEPKKSPGKGTRIIKEQPSSDPVRQRKSGPNVGTNWLLPIVGCIAALALVIGVRASFKNKAIETSKTLKDERIAIQQAKDEITEREIAKYQIPDDHRELLPPIPPLSESSELDSLEFDIGSGEAKEEEKASEKKNATSGDWKLK